MTHPPARTARHVVGGRRRRVVAALVTVPLLLVGVLAAPAGAASVSFAATQLTATVVGSQVTVSASVSATSTTTVTAYAVCARGPASSNADFAHRKNAVLGPQATTYSATKTLTPGTYQYYVCINQGGTWSVVGQRRSFTVAATATSATGSTTSASRAPVGDLPGWKQVFVENFDTSSPLGGFTSSTYASSWVAYRGFADTSQRGWYDPAKVISVGNGALDWYVHSEQGVHYVSALVPKVPSTGWGQTYGRYSFRFRADVLPRYKIAFLLWPDSNNWGEGEIDFPETADLSAGQKIGAALHPYGDTTTGTPSASRVVVTDVDAASSGWHVATIEWSAGRVVAILDGVTVGSDTFQVPTTSFHLVFQVETALDGAAPADATAGHVQLDWVTMYSAAG
ncbi:MAG: glycoside hydrolase family 16 protein [Cellulomonas sp.]|nr:glycoside hydrolase family 16 protein [Cellulomonas sp.]